MDVILILVIVMGFIMFLLVTGLILLYYLVWFRKRTILHVLTQDLKFINTTLKRVPSLEVHCKDGTATGGTYFYRHEKAIKTFWGTHAYYYQGISEPIDFSRRDLIPIPKIMAADMEKILQSDFITKLFHGQQLEKTIMLLQIITLICCIGIIILIFAMKPEKVSCLAVGDNSSFNFIRQACRGL